MKEISLHIIDILQNSIRANASEITLEVIENQMEDSLTLHFIDNGCGMDAEQLAKVTDPFFTTRTTRKVGLGLPLLKQNAERTGGCLQIQSKKREGTTVTVAFGLTHIDCPPLGDLASAVVLTAVSYPAIRFIFRFKTSSIDYVFDTADVSEALDGVSIQNPKIVHYLIEMVRENIAKDH